MSRTILIHLTTIVLCCFSLLFADDLSQITFMTEQYPPYNFVENEELKGIAVDILKEIFKEAGSTNTIDKSNVHPWSTAYRKTMAVTNHCLFSTTKTEERTPLFKWVGPISATRIVLIAKKGSGIKITNAEDLKKYSVGVIRDDVAHQLLQEQTGGLEKLQMTSNNIGNITKLENGVIQLWGYEESSAFWQLKSFGRKVDDFEVVYLLKESELYFAFNIQTDDAAIKTMQNSLNSVKAAGKISVIKNKYVK